MLYLNTKYLMITTFDFESPYVICSIHVHPHQADIATEKAWAGKTPELLWLPAVRLDVLRWLGYVARKAALAGLQFTKSQRDVLDSLPEEIASQIGVNAKAELAHGAARADARLPADPAWIPEVEEAQAILGALVRFDGAKPWEGYKAPVYPVVAQDRGKGRAVEEKPAEKEEKAAEPKARKRTFTNQPRETASGKGLF